MGLAQSIDQSTVDFWALWSLDPWIISGLLIAAWLYIRGWRSLARRTRSTRQDLKTRAWLFAAGMGTLVLALISPLHGLSEVLFSAHMAQHILLMLVAAPLLVLSFPLPAFLLGLPAGIRRTIGSVWRRSGWLRSLWHWISLPLVAWLLQAGFLWIWHVPGLYQAAVENDFIHAIEHLSFLGSAMLFWWVALYTLAKHQKRRGIAILYLLTAALQGGLLGALLVFSTRVWYPVYAGRAAHWGLSVLADQQLAGTIMSMPAGLVYVFAALLMMQRREM